MAAKVNKKSSNRRLISEIELAQSDELVSDSNVHKTCYIYRSKGRKSTGRAKFELLSSSVLEKKEHASRRWKLYSGHITRIYDLISRILVESDQSTVAQVLDFIFSASEFQPDLFTMIPTGLVLAGANISDHARLFANIGQKIEQDHEGAGVVIQISSRNVTTLRDFLRLIVGHVMKQQRDDDDLGDGNIKGHYLAGSGTDKRLGYDLDVLVDWYVKQDILKRIIVVIQDVEGFDGRLLAEGIRLLHAYRNRLPFVFLFGIATTLPIFSSKISKYTVRMLQFCTFDVLHANARLAKLIEIVLLSPEMPIVLGPNLFRQLLKRYNNSTKNLDTFVLAFQYAIMTFFYANPLSVMISSPKVKDLTDSHVHLLRNLPSFKAFIDYKTFSVLAEGDAKVNAAKDGGEDPVYIESLLQSSSSLIEFANSEYTRLRELISMKRDMIKILLALQNASPVYSTTYDSRTFAELYADVLTGRLLNTDFYDGLVGYVSKMSSDVVTEFVKCLTESFSAGTAISKLIKTWKVEELNGKPHLHAKLLSNISVSLSELFEAALVSYEDIVFHEIFVYDSYEILKLIFAPMYRATVETALSQPDSYLLRPDNDLDTSIEQPVSPLVSIAYRLYRESGTLINIYDFWRAFHEAVNGGFNHIGEFGLEDSLDRNHVAKNENTSGSNDYVMNAGLDRFDESQTAAWFLQAVNELRYLGFVKNSISGRRGPKTVQHSVGVLTKLAWDGL
ncbi:origin recognition complex subunit 3 N-terminus-domain-containing protein [Lipomyces oligophaga]|uniref:origin recognition complex subunit 3 N-terminus-domain-containing protein n=1 Tax=Lipomyces oligophaga TaxID=45792 RepID=UPI0034CD1EBB